MAHGPFLPDGGLGSGVIVREEWAVEVLVALPFRVDRHWTVARPGDGRGMHGTRLGERASPIDREQPDGCRRRLNSARFAPVEFCAVWWMSSVAAGCLCLSSSRQKPPLRMMMCEWWTRRSPWPWPEAMVGGAALRRREFRQWTPRDVHGLARPLCPGRDAYPAAFHHCRVAVQTKCRVPGAASEVDRRSTRRHHSAGASRALPSPGA